MQTCKYCGGRVPMFGEVRRWHLQGRCTKLSPTREQHEREQARRMAIRRGERGKEWEE